MSHVRQECHNGVSDGQNAVVRVYTQQPLRCGDGGGRCIALPALRMQPIAAGARRC